MQVDHPESDGASAAVLDGGSPQVDEGSFGAEATAASSTAGEGQRKERPPLPENYLTPESRFESAILFNIKPENRVENGPSMTGRGRLCFQGEVLDVPISAFTKAGSDSGLVYLSLVFGGEHDMRYSGSLFRAKDDLYSGRVTVLPLLRGSERHSPEVWEAAPELRITGVAGRTFSGNPKIELNIFPDSATHELPI